VFNKRVRVVSGIHENFAGKIHEIIMVKISNSKKVKIVKARHEYIQIPGKI